MKSLKKIIAGAMAVVMTATIGALNVSASTQQSTPQYYDTWTTTYRAQANTGTYTGTKDYCYMKFSYYGYEVAINSMKCSYAGTSGSVTITTISPNVNHTSINLTEVGEVRRMLLPQVDLVEAVSFEVYSSISPAGNYIEASGYMDVVL